MKKCLVIIPIIFLSNFSFSQDIGIYGSIVGANQHTNYFPFDVFVTSHFGVEFYNTKNELLNYTFNISVENKGFNHTTVQN